MLSLEPTNVSFMQNLTTKSNMAANILNLAICEKRSIFSTKPTAKYPKETKKSQERKIGT